MSAIVFVALALVPSVLAENKSSSEDTCPVSVGPWAAALEDWVTADRVMHTRHGRIMALSSNGYYVSDRIDLVPPPPPPLSQGGMLHRGPYPAAPAHPPESPPRGAHYAPPPRLQAPSGAPQSYDEWQSTPPPPPGGGKIINRPANPYKDQFKPSYPVPSPPVPIPVHGVSDRVDEARPPPHRQVSETDLYLLGAIEKLVYRVDLMEKRLRKMEENMHYLVVGTEVKPEPCQSNFTRVGGRCYHVSTEPLNWKNANYACRKLKGHLLEMDDEEKRALTAGLLADKGLKGLDYWTGGLNPGLLWIWAHSAAAVGNTTADPQDATTIVGEGRCLALVHDPALNTYVYRGQDCGLRHRYVCERDEDKSRLGNEIERVARAMRHKQRAAKVIWRGGTGPTGNNTIRIARSTDTTGNLS